MTRWCNGCGSDIPSRMRAHVSRSPARPSSPCVCGGISTRSPPGTASSAEFTDSGAPTVDGRMRCWAGVCNVGFRRPAARLARAQAPRLRASELRRRPAREVARRIPPAPSRQSGRTRAAMRAPRLRARQRGQIRMRDAAYSGVPVPGVMWRSGGCAVGTQCYGEAPVRSRTPRK